MPSKIHVVAEAGTNHNGRVAIGRELIEYTDRTEDEFIVDTTVDDPFGGRVQRNSFAEVWRIVDELQDQNGKLDARMSGLTTENDALRVRVLALETENTALRVRVLTLESENIALRSSIVDLKVENAELKDQIRNVRRENNGME